MSDNENLFNEVDDIETLLGQMVGAASMCWEHVERAGVFDDQKARTVVEDGLVRFRQIRGDVLDDTDAAGLLRGGGRGE